MRSMLPSPSEACHSTRSPATARFFLPRGWQRTRCPFAVSTTQWRPWLAMTRPLCKAALWAAAPGGEAGGFLRGFMGSVRAGRRAGWRCGLQSADYSAMDSIAPKSMKPCGAGVFRGRNGIGQTRRNGPGGVWRASGAGLALVCEWLSCPPPWVFGWGGGRQLRRKPRFVGRWVGWRAGSSNRAAGAFPGCSGFLKMRQARLGRCLRFLRPGWRPGRQTGQRPRPQPNPQIRPQPGLQPGWRLFVFFPVFSAL